MPNHQLNIQLNEQQEHNYAARIQEQCPTFSATMPPEGLLNEPEQISRQVRAASEGKIARNKRKRQERKEAEENEREIMRLRNILMQDDKVINALARAAQRNTLDSMTEALREIALHVQDLSVLEQYQGSYSDEMVALSEKMSILAITSVQDNAKAETLLNDLEKCENQYYRIRRERNAAAIATTYLPQIFRQECLANPLFQRACDEMDTVCDESMTHLRYEKVETSSGTNDMGVDEAFGESTAALLSELHLPKMSQNHLISKYDDLFNDEIMERVRVRTKYMMDNRNYSYSDARRYALYELRKEAMEGNAWAAERTKKSGVVATSDESDREYGYASFHYTLPAIQAMNIVDNANGMLFAKKVDGYAGIRELRPTLPEFVSKERQGEDGKVITQQIAIRRPYQLFMKALAHTMVNVTKGEVRAEKKFIDNAVEKLGRIADIFTDISP